MSNQEPPALPPVDIDHMADQIPDHYDEYMGSEEVINEINESPPITDQANQEDSTVKTEDKNLQIVEDKILPHNFEAEKSLLGSILLNNLAHERVSEYLKPNHFGDSLHGSIYNEISILVNRGHIADVISVSQYLKDNELFKEAGGNKFLLGLLDFPVSVYNADDYGKMIYDLHLRRELINIGHTIVHDAHKATSETTAISLIEDMESELFELASTGDTSKSFTDFKSAISEALTTAMIAHKRDGGLAGIDTGLKELNYLLGGLHKSDLLILAGRPSMGKTALATNIAFNAAKKYYESNGEEGAPVAFFSLEMSASQLASRILSGEAEVQSDSMRKGILEESDFEKLVDTVELIQNAPLFIDDTAGITVAAIRTRARRLKRQHNIGLIVIDYLQLITGGNKYSGSRVNEVSEITRGLKILAKELDIPVMALSQLSRSLESRDDKRPQLSDLRESGSIEQDADVVMFVYRHEYYLERTAPQEGSDGFDTKFPEWDQKMSKFKDKAEIIIQKQRHGPLGKAVVKFVSEHAQFKNLDLHEIDNHNFTE